MDGRLGVRHYFEIANSIQENPSPIEPSLSSGPALASRQARTRSWMSAGSDMEISREWSFVCLVLAGVDDHLAMVASSSLSVSGAGRTVASSASMTSLPAGVTATAAGPSSATVIATHSRSSSANQVRGNPRAGARGCSSA